MRQRASRVKALVLVCTVAIASATAACGAAPRVGEHRRLEGTLVLKGNEPHTVPVLVLPGSQQWELLDVQPAAAAALQNRKVRASGVVARLADEGPLLPALRVGELKPAP